MARGEDAKMPDLKPMWHGVPREKIDWYPTVDNELCIGCGICVLGCGPGVYAFDFDKRKPVVVAPLDCKVGCVTCANTCPVHAIGFPPLSYLHGIIKKEQVLTRSRKELESSRERVAFRK
jgi:CDP-4-dehydro-6-deoxyglucose reductase